MTKTLKELVHDFLEAQAIADESAAALLDSAQASQNDLSDKTKEKVSDNTYFQECFRGLELLNVVNDNTAYLLLESHEERCKAFIKAILTLVMKINVDLEDMIRKEDGEYYDALMLEADRRIQKIANIETRFFKSMQQNPALFKRANDLMYDAFDDLNPKILDVDSPQSTLIISGSPERTAIFATVNGSVEGAMISFVNQRPASIDLYEDGNFLYGFDFNEDGEGGTLDLPDEKKSFLPAVGAIGGAALLTAAVLMKINSNSAQIKVVKDVATQSV